MQKLQQITMTSIDQLVDKNHNYRKFINIWDFSFVNKKLSSLKRARYEGYGLPCIFRCLLLQFLEDLSDRELEKMLQENNAAKWFCGFSLDEKTPDHTVFSKARKRIGVNLLSEFFNDFKKQLKAKGYMNEVFTFVDASHLIAKAALWQERDKAIKQRYDKLNNEILPKVAHDKEARIGCKGKNKFWYGYKKHVSVDMQSGLINKVTITPANVTDGKGLKHVCPSQGAIYADKGYCSKNAHNIALKKGACLKAILKNNMKAKNRDLDRWISKIRSPYERVFSNDPKRVRYVGIAKNQFAAFMQAFCFNLKRLLVLSPHPKMALTG